jgi:hypothetical protein
VHSRDYLIDYFGYKTLERAYLIRYQNKVVERIQHMWMRVAIGIHGANCEKALETYHLMSQKYFTHATPTLFNAGTNRQQWSSCFLIQMESDTIAGAVALASLKSRPSTPINVGNPYELTMLELSRYSLEITNSTSQLVFNDLPVDDPKQRCPDISKARVILNWEPKIDLFYGLTEPAKYFSNKLK